VAHAYTSVEELKSALQIPADDPVDDPALQLAAEAASEMVDDHCHRRFDQVAGTRLYTVDAGYVVLDDVATLEGLVVAVDEDNDRVHERVLAVDEYHTLPLNALTKGRPIEYLKDLAVAPTCTGGVKVTATFGWPEVPAQVRHAVMAVALRLFAFRGPFGTAGSAELGSQTQAQAWAAAGVEPQLKPFVRRDPVVA
jgi:hypothetical protein